MKRQETWAGGFRYETCKRRTKIVAHVTAFRCPLAGFVAAVEPVDAAAEPLDVPAAPEAAALPDAVAVVEATAAPEGAAIAA